MGSMIEVKAFFVVFLLLFHVLIVPIKFFRVLALSGVWCAIQCSSSLEELNQGFGCNSNRNLPFDTMSS